MLQIQEFLNFTTVAIQCILVKSRKVVDEILCHFFEGWDVSRATTCLISMLILITIHIQEFSNRILPLWNEDKNCADQLPALVEVSVCF